MARSLPREPAHAHKAGRWMAELRLHFRRPQVVNKEAPRSVLSTKDLGLHSTADTHTQDGHTQRETVIPARTWREGDLTRERRGHGS